MASVLNIRGLGHSVGGRTLYRGLDVAVHTGRVTAVVGPNGAGKSTLLRQLAGLARADVGTIDLDGTPLAAIDPRARARRLAYLPQRTSLAVDLRVHELVTLGRAAYLPAFGAPSASDRAAVTAALERLDLMPLAARQALSLSGGELQRVMLARMLASAATVLILDEPTAALDIGHALGFLAEIRQLARDGVAVVLAIHELEQARRCADDAVLLGHRDGPLAGPAADVLTPANLGPTFGVHVQEVAGHLVFTDQAS